MEIAITVTAAPQSQDLLLDAAAALQRDLNGEADFRWLAEGEAMDLILAATGKAPSKAPSPQPSPTRGEGAMLHAQHQHSDAVPCSNVPSPLAGEGQDEGEGALSALKAMVAEAIADRPLDWCVQPAQGRKKRMLIADMDSTIIGQECLDEMADLRGIKPEIAALTERAMRGELDFEAALRERIRLLAGMTPADLQHVLHEHITLNFGARTLVRDHERAWRAYGARIGRVHLLHSCGRGARGLCR